MASCHRLVLLPALLAPLGCNTAVVDLYEDAAVRADAASPSSSARPSPRRSETAASTTSEKVASSGGPDSTPATQDAPAAGPCPPRRRCDYQAFADPAHRPTITEVLVQKERHQLHLVAEDAIVRSYSVALGSGGMGQKMYEGDKITPIGSYRIAGRYPSKWHTYLALDYPGEVDKARHAAALARGEIPDKRGPGSAIAIHGHRADQPSRLHKAFDWTLGCVSLDNDEIDEVAAVAPVGTRVTIEP